jgi:hypothetical protein
MKNRLLPLVIALVSLLATFLFNEYNVRLIRNSGKAEDNINTQSLYRDRTVYSVDNEYYISAPENYIRTGKWVRSPGVSNGDYYRRVPGYSLWYYAFVKPLGIDAGLSVIKIAQLILFSVSVFFVFLTLERLTARRRLSVIFTLLYGLTPMFSGWIYFTMTEALTPVQCVMYLYFITGAYYAQEKRKKYREYFIASIFFGILVMTRPYMAVLGIIPVLLLLRERWDIRILFISFTVPALMVAAWTWRNYKIAGEFVPLEVSVHPQTLDRMKPDMEGLFAFARCWGIDGPESINLYDSLYITALRGDTSSARVNAVIEKFPAGIVAEFGHDRLFTVVKEHQRAIADKAPYHQKRIAMPSEFLPRELKVREMYDELTSEFKAKHPFTYWIKSPAIYLRRMLFHSNTSNVYFFQAKRGNILADAYRYLLFVFHFLMYAFILYNAFFARRTFSRIVFGITPLIFVFFFCVVLRSLEQRYMLPVLPVLLAGMVSAISEISQRLSEGRSKVS